MYLLLTDYLLSYNASNTNLVVMEMLHTTSYISGEVSHIVLYIICYLGDGPEPVLQRLITQLQQ